MNNLHFFKSIRDRRRIDYTVVVDKSGSMSWYPDRDAVWDKVKKALTQAPKPGERTRWDQAKDAVRNIVPRVIELDPDGITLYMFSKGEPLLRDGITDPKVVDEIFTQVHPVGGTDLFGVLSRVFEARHEKDCQEAVLVVTDGQPDNGKIVKELIANESKKFNSPEDMFLSFVQVGNNAEATRFLNSLEMDLMEKFNAHHKMVDTISAKEFTGEFAEVIDTALVIEAEAEYESESVLSENPNDSMGKETKLSFFTQISMGKQIVYTVILDKSGSMSWFPDKDAVWDSEQEKLINAPGPHDKTRWKEAKSALEYIVPFVTDLNKTGIELHMFSKGDPLHLGPVSTLERVDGIFRSTNPLGGTDLSGCLESVLEKHRERGLPEAILIITDGQPDNEERVKKLIAEASRKEIKDPRNPIPDPGLTISFIQVGSSPEAENFLDELHHELEPKYNASYEIVDYLSQKDLGAHDFSKFVKDQLFAKEECKECPQKDKQLEKYRTSKQDDRREIKTLRKDKKSLQDTLDSLRLKYETLKDKEQRLNDQLEEINAANSNHVEEHEKLMEKKEDFINQLRGTLDEERKKFVDSQKVASELDLLKADNERLKKKLATQNDKLRDVEDEVEKKNRENRDLEDENDEARNTIESLKKLLDQEQQKNADALIAQNDEIMRQIGKLEKDKSQLMDEHGSLGDKTRSLERKLKNAKDTIEELKIEIYQLKSQKDELADLLRKEEDKTHKSRMEQLSVENLKKKITELEIQRQSASSEHIEILDELQKKLRKVTMERNSITEMHFGCEPVINNLKNIVKEKDLLIDRKVSELKQVQDTLNRKMITINMMKRELAEKDDEINALIKKLNDKQTEIDELKEKLTKARGEITSMQEFIDELKQNLNAMKQKLEDKDQIIRSLRDQIDALQDQLNRKKVEIRNLERDLEARQKNYDTVLEQRQDFHDKYQDEFGVSQGLRSQNTELQSENDVLQGEVAKMDALKQELEDLKDKIKHVRQLEAEIERLKKLVSSLETQNNELRQSESKYLQEIELLEGVIQRLENELQKLKDEMERLEEAHDKDMKKKHDMIDALEDELKNERDRLGAEIAEKRGEIEEAKEAKHAQEVEHTEAVGELQVHKQQLSNDCAMKEKEIDRLNSTIKRLQTMVIEYRNVLARNKDLIKKLEELKNGMTYVQDELRKNGEYSVVTVTETYEEEQIEENQDPKLEKSNPTEPSENYLDNY